MYNGYVPDPSLVEGERSPTCYERIRYWSRFPRRHARPGWDYDNGDNDGDDDRGTGRAPARSDDAQDPVGRVYIEELDVSHAYEHRPIDDEAFVSPQQRTGVHEILPQAHMFHTPTMGTAVGGVELGVSYRMPPIPRGATRVLIDSGAQANCTGIPAHVPGSRTQPDGSTGRPGAICGGSGGACEVTHMQTTM